MTEAAPPDPPDRHGAPRDLGLEPVGRDPRFLVRLILALLVGLIAASYVGLKLKGAASGCGSGLIRPGTTVIPPEHPGSNR